MRMDRGRKAVEAKAQTLERLKVEYVACESIHPNLYNPNRQSEHEFDLLLRSIKEDGFTQPVIVQRQTREIVDGEHRWRAAQAVGLREIPAVFVDMTPEQMRVATLRHNRARGSEDIELTAQVLRDLQQLGALEFVQDALQIDDVELNALLQDIMAPDALAADEFTEAWQPGESGGVLAEDGMGAAGAQVTRANTHAALFQRRDQERRLAEAKTEEERAIVRRESAIYRLSLVFGGEEAALVKRVLGERPAEALVTLCRKVETS